MATPEEEINAYLASIGTAGPRRLRVAIGYAESMLDELRASVAEWQAAAGALHDREDAEGRAAARANVRYVPAGRAAELPLVQR